VYIARGHMNLPIKLQKLLQFADLSVMLETLVWSGKKIDQILDMDYNFRIININFKYFCDNKVSHIILTRGCSLYEKACPNNNIAEYENKAFHVVRSSILQRYTWKRNSESRYIPNLFVMFQPMK